MGPRPAMYLGSSRGCTIERKKFTMLARKLLGIMLQSKENDVKDTLKAGECSHLGVTNLSGWFC